ncbi:cellulase family glycosylhydrolase [Sphingomonas sp. RRHST34]|uniref:Cellulase family glycosylhydrolase n=1 Tax=Sphingomonas citri TaxID=2862499 RepID=A0ABS7BPW8_9SPHN|nr:cellulase family glycosylhydrolase [Sphingomonas citri]MBW6531655.1 cellulase family glycosylhydrolase [Sphingomonas citri]
MSLKKWPFVAAGTIAATALAAAALWSQVPTTTQVTFAAAPPPGRYTPPIFGAQTHFGMGRLLGYTNGPRAATQLRSIGANSYRDGIIWAQFSFPPDGPPVIKNPRRIVDFLPVAGARPLFGFAGPPFPLSPSGMPLDDAQLKQFADYAEALVRMTKPYGTIYEVWNEWNLRVGQDKPPARLNGEGDPSDARAAVHYARVAKVAVQATKRANPNAPIVVGSAGDDPDWKWTQAIVRYGALDGADGISVHTYNHCQGVNNRTANEMLTRLQRLQTLLRQQRGGRDTPIYVTEFGWPTVDGKCGVSRQRQAYNFAHYILQSSTLPWLRASWAYELKDEGQDPKDMEQNFGIFGYDDQPKPAACFIKEARAIVTAARAVELKQPRPDVFVLRALMPDRQLAVVWTNSMNPSSGVRFAGRPSGVRMMCGDTADAGGDLAIGQAPLVARYPLGQPIALAITG